MKKIPFISILVIIAAVTGCNSKKDTNIKQTVNFDLVKQVESIGSDTEEIKPGNYESIWTYVVDYKNNVFVADMSKKAVDKFDSNGKYLFSFGGLTHKAIEYPGWIEQIAVDSKENLISYCATKRRFLFFSNDGKIFKEIDCNDDLKKLDIKKIKIDRIDNLFALGYSKENGYRLIRYDLHKKSISIIHTDNKRIRPAFADLLPDFDFCENDDIYIIDTVDYSILKYSNTGRFIGSFTKNVKKNKIEEGDSNYLMQPDKVRKIQKYDEGMKSLTTSSGFFPAVFGINIDSKRIYIWTSNQDADKKYIVDVYDLEFKWVGSISCYNSLPNNVVFIKSGRLYLPNIGSEDKELKSAIGRFGFFKFPYKIEIYKISCTPTL